MFKLEEADFIEFNSIDNAINEGANIFFTLDDNDNVMACSMVAPRDNGEWEIFKFAAKNLYTGTGAGNLCFKACINYAKEMNAKKIIIVQNTKCEAAIHLYRKNGFIEVEVDRNKFPFERGNIAFELELNKYQKLQQMKEQKVIQDFGGVVDSVCIIGKWILMRKI